MVNGGRFLFIMHEDGPNKIWISLSSNKSPRQQFGYCSWCRLFSPAPAGEWRKCLHVLLSWRCFDGHFHTFTSLWLCTRICQSQVLVQLIPTARNHEKKIPEPVHLDLSLFILPCRGALHIPPLLVFFLSCMHVFLCRQLTSMSFSITCFEADLFSPVFLFHHFSSTLHWCRCIDLSGAEGRPPLPPQTFWFRISSVIIQCMCFKLCPMKILESFTCAPPISHALISCLFLEVLWPEHQIWWACGQQMGRYWTVDGIVSVLCCDT